MLLKCSPVVNDIGKM